MPPVIQVSNLSKRYRLGQIGGGTLYGDLNRWWAKVRGAPDPTLKIGQQDHGNGDGEYIWALKDVSFEVDQGEILGIIGKNGAGKSTLLKILSRITAPTSGEVRIKGRVGSLLEVGTGFHPELTGRENIYLNGAILGMSTQEVARKFDEIVDFSGVEQFIDTPVKRYSSGMYVRLAFAVAAHLDPEILVVDEVLAVGDAEFQKKCLGKMDEVAREEGRTVLFVSHNMGVIIRLCPDALLIHRGNVLSWGNSKSVVDKYLKSFDNSKSSKSWDLFEAPGSAKVKLLSIKVVDIDGQDRQSFRSDEPIRVVLEYQILREIIGGRIGIRILDASGTILFATMETDTREKIEDKIRFPGHYISYCDIPSNLLNSGQYSLTVTGDIPMREILINTEPLITFEVNLIGGIATSHSDHRPGYFRPAINWEIAQIE